MKEVFDLKPHFMMLKKKFSMKKLQKKKINFKRIYYAGKKIRLYF